MQVKEVISLLKQYDEEAEVYIQDCGNPVSIYQIKSSAFEFNESEDNPIIEGNSIGT